MLSVYYIISNNIVYDEIFVSHISFSNTIILILTVLNIYLLSSFNVVQTIRQSLNTSHLYSGKVDQVDKIGTQSQISVLQNYQNKSISQISAPQCNVSSFIHIPHTLTCAKDLPLNMWSLIPLLRRVRSRTINLTS